MKMERDSVRVRGWKVFEECVLNVIKVAAGKLISNLNAYFFSNSDAVLLRFSYFAPEIQQPVKCEEATWRFRCNCKMFAQMCNTNSALPDQTNRTLSTILPETQ